MLRSGNSRTSLMKKGESQWLMRVKLKNLNKFWHKKSDKPTNKTLRLMSMQEKAKRMMKKSGSFGMRSKRKDEKVLPMKT